MSEYEETQTVHLRYKEDVALNILNNSEKVKADFLQEIANHKLVDSIVGIVKCYGISQDPKTKNYIIVMEHIKNGNLKQYSSDKQLDFKDRFSKLRRIADGLNSIHKQGLVHRDFHPGNILLHEKEWTYISDLGLSRP